MRGRGWKSFLVRAFNRLKLMQKQSKPSFFLSRTTALHHGLLLGRMAPASNINFRCSLTSSTCGGRILWKCSLKGGVAGVPQDDFMCNRLGLSNLMASPGRKGHGTPSGGCGLGQLLPLAMSPIPLGPTSPSRECVSPLRSGQADSPGAWIYQPSRQ